MKQHLIIRRVAVLCVLWVILLFRDVGSGQDTFGSAIDAEEQEIIENLDVLESMGLLQDMHILEHYPLEGEFMEYNESGEKQNE
jgi:hypothetical protein